MTPGGNAEQVGRVVIGVRPGDVVADRFRVTDELGRGGMGVVFAADHLQLPQQVAIKFLRKDADPILLERFRREAQIVVQLRSEHVCRVLDVGQLPSGEPFIIMEMLHGQDLANKVGQDGPLPMSDAVDTILQVCEALAEAHMRGVVHRDLKPNNLFLARRLDGSSVVKVLDFGISKSASHGDSSLTASGTDACPSRASLVSRASPAGPENTSAPSLCTRAAASPSAPRSTT